MAAGEEKETLVLKKLFIKNSGQHSILKTENLSIGYLKKKQKNLIASGINTEILEGQLVAVVGVNGVGKSTFLRTISGIQPALGGDVFIHGKNRRSISSEDLATFISLVLTEQPLSRNLSVKDLVSLGRQPYTNWIGSLSEDDTAKINKALELAQIQELKDRRCYELSDGQLQKTLIARALSQDTPLMILDEPTSHLDIYHKAQVLKLLKVLSASTGKGILFATHEINLALQLCDSIILMKKGEVQQGSPDELIARKAFENLFPKDLIVFDESTRTFRITGG